MISVQSPVTTSALLTTVVRHAGDGWPGFGKSWRKRYTISLDAAAADPASLMAVWLAHLRHFAPRGHQHFAPFTNLDRSDLDRLQSDTASGTVLSAGARVIAADATSLVLRVPEAHAFVGWVSFSTIAEGNRVSARVEIFMRAADPLSELSLELSGHRRDDDFWSRALSLLAAWFGDNVPVAIEIERLDDHYNWTQASNVLHNPTLRSGVGQVATPVRWGLALARWPFARDRAA